MKSFNLKMCLKHAAALCFTFAMLIVLNLSSKAATSGYYDYSVKSDGTARITKYTGDEIHCVIPSSLDGYTVTELDFSSFSKKQYMTTVTIPSTVTTLEGHVFAECKSLSSITIPDTVTSMGSYCFFNCPSLTSAKIGNGIKILENASFAKCPNLTTVTLSEGLEVIDGYVGHYGAFSESGITAISIPSTVTTIKEMAFHNCDSLTSVVIPDTVTSVEYWAFGECDSLRSIVVSSGIDTIPRSFAADCPNLTTVTFRGSTLKTIMYDAFSDCSSLTSVTLPSSVESIGDYTFKGCTSLASVKLNEGLGSIGGSVFRETAITELTIPSTVTSIGTYLFWDCPNLSKVTFLANTGKGSNIFYKAGGNPVVYCYSNSEYLEGLQKNADDSYITLRTMTAVPSTAVTLSPANVDLYVGDSKSFTTTLTPYNTTDTVEYTSSNTKIATVSQQGIITGVGKGSAIITARTNSGKLAQISVIVDQHPQRVDFSISTKTMKVGDTASIPAKVDNGDRTDVKITYTSSNPAVAVVSADGTVKAVSAGIATITASVYNGLTDTVEITVEYGPVQKVTISGTKKTMAVKQKLTLQVKVDNGRTDEAAKLTFTSNNPKVAKVNAKGVITATKKTGTAIITAKTANGKYDAIKITVKKAPTSIKFKKKTITLKVGNSVKLKHTLSKNTYTYKLTYKSNKQKIASVDANGKVTALKKGTCTITVKTHNGKKATCKIKVTK